MSSVNAAVKSGLGAAPSAAMFVAAGLVLGLGFYMVHNTIQTRVTEVAPEARGWLAGGAA